MLRLYAGCCRTPVANIPSPEIAFVGISHSFSVAAGNHELECAAWLLVRSSATRFDAECLRLINEVLFGDDDVVDAFAVEVTRGCQLSWPRSS